MKQRFSILVVGALLFAAGLAPDVAAQEKAPVQAVNLDQLKEKAPKVYIDCLECDLDYIRTEITFVNYVRDRKEADVHILITTQDTGSGGRVDITVDRIEGAGRVVVEDTGIGILEESIPGIFDRFSVVDASRSKDTEGVGLGLSIAKRVADIHGAVIDVFSRVGEGTCFIVRFPPA